MAKRPEGRYWCFTLNNPKDGEAPEATDDIGYLVYQKEQGVGGTPHLQGYCAFKKKKRLAFCKRFIERAHWELAKGSAAENKAYCTKCCDDYKERGHCCKNTRIDEAVEYGECPAAQQGARTDLAAAVETARKRGYAAMVDEHPCEYAKYSKGLRELALRAERKVRRNKPEVWWIHGATGTGKSRWADRIMPDAWWSRRDLQWFEGYEGHKEVVFDDFRADYCKFHVLLRLLDRYKFEVDIKGSSWPFNPDVIVITSPKHPSVVYNKSEEDMQQLLRRIDYVGEFTKETKTFLKRNGTMWVGLTNPPVFNE